MSRQVDEAAERILPPLSHLLKRTLRVDESTKVADAFAVHLALGNLSVVAENEPFSDNERQFIRNVFDVVRSAEENDVRARDLQERLTRLELQNLELIMTNRVLSEVTARDSLTGLYNRWYVMDKIESEINRSLRHGSPMALMLLDIDHFKRINDTFGHTAGDQVLQSVGKLLKESCRVYDVPGRYGGEEFCVLLPQMEVGNSPSVAERIQHRLASNEMSFGGASVTVTASIGIAGLDAAGGQSPLSPTALIDRADRALYTAKNRGRNRYEIWDAGLTNMAPDDISH